jgi:prepilin-type processing-associated H-X9-DG protein
MLLPMIEQGTLYNAVNFLISPNGEGMVSTEALYTAWVTMPSVFLCPSDGTNGNGFLPGTGPTGNYGNAPPIIPGTSQSFGLTPVSNYQGSFGDNYCGGQLITNGAPGGGLPWETPDGSTPPPGFPRIGWDGYWGTWFGPNFTPGQGTQRGFFDYRSTFPPTSISSATDGTSNSIIVGEILPARAADANFWDFNGAYAGMTVPLGWNSNTFPPADPSCLYQWQNATAPLGCRYSAAAKGFVSLHPGGANFAFADGSVHFLKNTISLITYCALGSVAGGEVISSGSY